MKERRSYASRFEEAEEVFEKPVEKKNRTGHISGCELLNVRKEPMPNAPVIAVLNTSDLFVVQGDDDPIFFKVKTVNGVSGYCMKKFVTVDD